jgi:hypothetical protein
MVTSPFMETILQRYNKSYLRDIRDIVKLVDRYFLISPFLAWPAWHGATHAPGVLRYLDLWPIGLQPICQGWAMDRLVREKHDGPRGIHIRQAPE